jgi:hypothetical protein
MWKAGKAGVFEGSVEIEICGFSMRYDFSEM